ncbi:hypothetical protein P691DRAFT_802637 [Macrolepiota fuliginosa MF-IS2]|uniref:Uncharacterized protein n=1 Tax=Macrolepiota fuliginosa MF-IS2 TaxID=1400762 RepID=A0A9P5WXM0_9AGAR|nr:hypothetical protein P691DRAFT_802637 [Macrolepiota fuliginosa MF-IS2]
MLVNTRFLLAPATFLVLVLATLSVTVQALPVPVLDIRQSPDGWNFQQFGTVRPKKGDDW